MKLEKIITYLFVSIIFITNIGIFANYGYSKVSKKKQKYSVSFDKNNHQTGKIETIKQNKHIDVYSLFPFDKKIDDKEQKGFFTKINTKISKFFYRIKMNIKNLDDRIKLFFPFRLSIVALNRYITGSRKSFLSLDSLVSLKDQYFAFTINRKQNFEEQANRVVDFSKSLEKNGIKFCSVTYPSKFSKFKPDFPPGIVDYSNYNVDTYLTVLKKNNVNCFDLRKNADEQFKEHLPLFFKTDHHWRPETAFWATSEMVKYLNKEFNMGFNESLLNKDNFKFTTYKSLFLGSHGKKVTLALASPEDITIIEPNFPTRFETCGLDQSELKIGGYSDVLLNYKELFYDNPYEGDAYNTYSSPSYIKNLSSEGKNKVVIIHDSFSIPVIPFLSVVSKELVHIDVRWENKFSVEKYILDLKPDVVILAYATDRYNWDRDPNHMENMFVFK